MTDTMTDRPGIPNSGEVTVSSGDGSSVVHTVLDTRDDAVFEVNQIVIEYPTAGATAVVTIHDDADGTSNANLNSSIKTIRVDTSVAGERITLDNMMLRDFQEDVIAQTDGNQDQDMQIYVDGKIITDAAIVDE